ncbi:hypothetical protein DQE84_20715, partial [Staphylococcus warneri]
ARNIVRTFTTLEDKHKDLSKQLHDVATALEENPNSKKNKTQHTQIKQQYDSNERKKRQSCVM